MPLDETLSEIVIFILILFSAGFFYLLNRIFEKIPHQQKSHLLLLGLLTSPIWAGLAIFFLFSRLPAILGGQIDPVLDFFTLLTSLTLIYIYFVLANFPATLSYAISAAWQEGFSEKSTTATSKSFWLQLTKLKKRRLVVFLLLLTCLVVLMVFDSLLFLAFLERYLDQDTFLRHFLLVVGILLAIFYLVVEIFQSKKLTLAEVPHQKSNLAKKLIENLSLAAGITPPQTKILSHTQPTAFSFYPNFGQPAIYLATSLLNLADKKELEAVIAHESAHIFSGWVFGHHLMDNLLIALRFFSFLLLLLFLTAVNPILLAFWLGAVFYVSAGKTLDQEDWPGDLGSLSKTAATLANPPFVFLNFLSYFIYYFLTFSEDHFADLKAIQLTRFPKALYSILDKLENYTQPLTDHLPLAFFDLYFTGESMTRLEIPPPQPPITERKKLLAELDYTLTGFKLKKSAAGLSCPLCHAEMAQFTSQSHYGLPIEFDRCPRCGGVWFDKWELWYLADLASITLPQEKATLEGQFLERLAPNNQILCPRCQVKLLSLTDPVIPGYIQIWRCPSCQGNFLEKTALFKYHEYQSSKKVASSH